MVRAQGEAILRLGDMAAFPVADKIGFWTDSGEPANEVRVRRGQRLDYYDGEL
jgi:hypothetical protein